MGADYYAPSCRLLGSILHLEVVSLTGSGRPGGSRGSPPRSHVMTLVIFACVCFAATQENIGLLGVIKEGEKAGCHRRSVLLYLRSDARHRRANTARLPGRLGTYLFGKSCFLVTAGMKSIGSRDATWRWRWSGDGAGGWRYR